MLLSCSVVFGQTGDTALSGINKLSAKTFDRIGAWAARTEKRITRQTAKHLDQLAKQESRLEKALYGRDSGAAKRLFGGSQQQYRAMLTTLLSSSSTNHLPALKEYLPVVDSLHAALHFLGGPGATTAGLSLGKLEAIGSAAGQLQQLEGRWQQARDVESFIRQREQQLSGQLTGQGLSKSLLRINKSAFYFQQQLVEYKSLLADRDRLQQKVLNSLRNSPAFQHFMQTNSYVGRMFSLPENYGSPASLSGLQTKTMVQQRLGLGQGSSRPSGGSGAEPGQFLQQKVDNGQQQLGLLKSKLRSLGNFSGGGDVVMPRFTPNDQKVKTFLHRIEYGVNLQTQQSYGIMPATADLGLLLGYKLSSKATIGVGGSYNIGLKGGLGHLSYSGQGAGIRSYIDVRARGSLWLTGGWEYNYVRGFSTWRDLSHWNEWQKSALFGLSKKFKLSAARTSSLQLLFDALYKQHVPASSPLIFRVGYSFN
ncbi:hypothetical protein GCM10011511_08830 [Puia dinghuensis]|uniref:Uncharacterized protein n=1 Tax=Puia dinghuensis TaxID=1792502 RepID=A0A8J2U938_9BACT|nr:hypothetical protein GCM10011511_08830 [Puia dinghuensis]